jgi:hypothetical protein
MMKQFDASQVNGSPLCCIVCGREIPGGNWFARIRSGSNRVACCGPRCVEKYADAPANFTWLARAGINGDYAERPQTDASHEAAFPNFISYEINFGKAGG